MLSEFRKRKVKGLMESMDFDGNGVIEKDDFEKVFQRMAENLQLLPGTPEYEGMHTFILSGWDSTRQLADANNDQQVTYEEFLGAVDTLINNREIFE
ncbi:MAG: EF-hand domain-containing protein [Chloroflexi bacterium]|nr:EF-hand domain-containing protein [Chloroflexota bacterium]